MADILIRDIPEEVATALSQKAVAAGKDRMAYIRDLLTKVASEPIVSERYAYRVYGKDGKGKITRHSDHPNGTGSVFTNFGQEDVNTIQKAEDLIRRNGVGDREKAVALLQQQFEEVVEVPV